MDAGAFASCGEALLRRSKTWPGTPRFSIAESNDATPDGRSSCVLEDLMSVENDTRNQNPEGEDRREPNEHRIAYEGLVELGGTLGPSFEAQAVDLSRGGMHLRTAYLPEIGQPLTCRFDMGTGEVLASAEVVWCQAEERGGEFAIRFARLDTQSTAAIGQLVDRVETCEPREPGARVRLHIDGLASPMRARVKDACASELTVGSELGFLQVGKRLELEDATTGGKRSAQIDRVEVEVDEGSKIPQLVVTLRYTDQSGLGEPALSPERAPVPIASARPGSKPDGTPEPSVIDGDTGAVAVVEDVDHIEPPHRGMKGTLARSAAQVGPAIGKLLKRARTTLTLLAARTKTSDDARAPTRRTTAPAPSGGLHANGRRLVRGEPTLEPSGTAPGGFRGARRIGLIAAVVCAAVIAFSILRRPAAPLASAPSLEKPATQVPVPTQVPASVAPSPPESPPAPTIGEQPPSTLQSENGTTPSATSNDADHGHRKVGRVTPFGNGAVTHGNVLRIKMDGVIEKIEGASLPTGFTVAIPNRRSLEAAAPLAARDSRIGSIRVANEAHGAELTVMFKDGVPNYQVRAKGDTLELVLASSGRVIESETVHEWTKPVAKKGHRQAQDKN